MNRQNLYNGDSYMGEMRSIEEVIKALELCRYDPDPGQEPKYSHSCMKCPYGQPDRRCAEMFADAIKLLEARRWIPFRVRPLTDEEKINHPEWCYILDCELPDDDEEVLVSNGKYVWVDTYINDGNDCYLDSGHELDGAAWMPMPEAYRKTEQ